MERRGRRRSGGAGAAGAAGGADGVARGWGFAQLPYQTHRNPYPPMELLVPEQLEKIHDASMVVLEEIGINFLLEDARDILKACGADVRPNDPRVRFDRDLIGELVAKAPSSFTDHPRNPARQLHYGGNYTMAAITSTSP